MHISIVGNINNFPFLLAEGLMELGCYVRLVLTRGDILHRPDKAGLIRGPLPEWIYDGAAAGLHAFERQTSDIADAIDFIVDGMDAVILNDVGPSLTNLIPLPAISFLTGSDLTYYADFDSGRVRRADWAPDYAVSPSGLMEMHQWESMIVRQRRGIRQSLGVSTTPLGVVQAADTLLEEIGVSPAQRMLFYFADVARIRPRPMPQGRFRVLNGARLNWAEMPPGFTDQDHKGTDVLLRGFAKFIGQGCDAELVLIEKGLHVPETRALVDELELGRSVTWLPELPLSEFVKEVERSHVIADQLGRSFPAMTALTAMAIGRPVLAKFPSALTTIHDEPWPVCDAQTEDDVTNWLSALYRSPQAAADMGQAARTFAECRLSPKSTAQLCLDRFRGRHSLPM